MLVTDVKSIGGKEVEKMSLEVSFKNFVIAGRKEIISKYRVICSVNIFSHICEKIAHVYNLR